jgi:hypothetical protein
MMTWHDKLLRRGWRVIRLIWWPAEFPLWVRVCAWLAGPVFGIGIIRGDLLITGAACALTLAIWFTYRWKGDA